MCMFFYMPVGSPSNFATFERTFLFPKPSSIKMSVLQILCDVFTPNKIGGRFGVHFTHFEQPSSSNLANLHPIQCHPSHQAVPGTKVNFIAVTSPAYEGAFRFEAAYRKGRAGEVVVGLVQSLKVEKLIG